MVVRGGSNFGRGGVSAPIFSLLVALAAALLLAFPVAPPLAAQSPRPPAAIAQPTPDGTVVLVNNTSGDVYISLTSKDRLRPGMPFTCFDRRRGITLGADTDARGNGTIEVMAVSDQFTLCRISRTSPNRAISPGDLLYNTLYHNSKNRPTHFVVFGGFDLDGDGIPTAAECDRLNTLIRASGGTIDDDIHATTDYLVLGTRPASPSLQDPPPDARPGSVVEHRTAEQKHYDDLQSAALQLAIPVLNTNRLLSMVGYYHEPISHP